VGRWRWWHAAGLNGWQASGGSVKEQRAGGRATGREKIDLAGGCGWVRDFGLSALTSVGPPYLTEVKVTSVSQGRYVNFRLLDLTDENSSMYIGFSSGQ
jgi:hypothetical protein